MANQGENAPIIQTPALDFSKYTTWATGIGTLGAAVVALVQTLQGQTPPAIIDGALAVVAAGLLAIAFVVATDVYSRAYVTSAQLKASPSTDPSASVASAQKANGVNTLATIGTPFSVQLYGKGNESFRVLAIQCDTAAKTTSYLVARQNERPLWVKEDEVQGYLS